MSGYLNMDCKNCGRHRVEENHVCEKCGFDNRENQYVNANMGKSGKEIIDGLYKELREWEKVAASLNNSLCCYLDYCECNIEYKCLAPNHAVAEYNKLRCGISNQNASKDIHPIDKSWRFNMPRAQTLEPPEPSPSDVSVTQDVLMDIKKGRIMSIDDWNTRPIEDALQAEIERLKSERRWIPVSERLPENRKQILVFIDGIPDYEGNSLSRITESYYDEKFVCWLGEYVTHWMPLPPPPEGEA